MVLELFKIELTLLIWSPIQSNVTDPDQKIRHYSTLPHKFCNSENLTVYFSKLAPKKTKSDAKPDEGESSPKKKKKAAKSPAKTEPSTDISVIKERKVINNVLHYTVKLVGQSGVKTLPIFGKSFFIGCSQFTGYINVSYTYMILIWGKLKIAFPL